ncbi:hypothetical protein [Mycolicibacterium komossense]|nr:hypothetical protein [Mycolicibacterium komossense]
MTRRSAARRRKTTTMPTMMVTTPKPMKAMAPTVTTTDVGYPIG